MKIARWFVLAVVLTSAPFLVGCGRKENSQTSTPASQQAAPRSQTPAAAGTLPNIWPQVQSDQDKLVAALNGGQLKDVHDLALGIRDLVASLPEQASGLSVSNTAALTKLVDQVKDSASKLADLGDARNLSGAKTEYQTLSKLLSSIKTICLEQMSQ